MWTRQNDCNVMFLNLGIGWIIHTPNNPYRKLPKNWEFIFNPKQVDEGE